MQLFNAELKVRLLDTATGKQVASASYLAKRFQHVISPFDVTLRAGERRVIHLPGPLQALPATERPTELVLATDRPGVRYHLGEDPFVCGYSNVLLTGGETIREQDFVGNRSPIFGDGDPNWLNHNIAVGNDPLLGQLIYEPSLRTFYDDGTQRNTSVPASATIAQLSAINWAGNALQLLKYVTGGAILGGLAHGSTRFVWGRPNKVDVAAIGSMISTWFFQPTAILPNGIHMKFGSHPYDTTTVEVDLDYTDGDDTDEVYLHYAANIPTGVTPVGGLTENSGPYFYYDMTSHPGVQADRWNHIQIDRSNFSEWAPGGLRPDWERITWFEFHNTGPVSDYCIWGPVMVLSEGYNWRKLNTIATETMIWEDHIISGNGDTIYAAGTARDRDEGVYLTLCPPDGHSARVSGFLGVV